MQLQVIQNMIYEIRGQKVMLDRDLAKLYGVETKALNQAVRRNIERFPEDFMFQLTNNESNLLEVSMRSQSVTSSWGGNRYNPYVFTEQGVAMLSSVLRSKTAIEINISIMRAFVSVRKMLSVMPGISEEVIALKRKMEELERSTLQAVNDLSEDTQREFDTVYLALSQMAQRLKDNPDGNSRKRIGYK